MTYAKSTKTAVGAAAFVGSVQAGTIDSTLRLTHPLTTCTIKQVVGGYVNREATGQNVRSPLHDTEVRRLSRWMSPRT